MPGDPNQNNQAELDCDLMDNWCQTCEKLQVFGSFCFLCGSKLKPFRRVLGERGENYAILSKSVKETRRTREGGGVA